MTVGAIGQKSSFRPPEVLNLFKSGPVAGQYAPPVFKDTKRGVLCVTYFEPGAEAGEDFRTLTLFSTNDGGINWHAESSVNLGQDRGVLAFTAVDSQALAPKLSGSSGLTLMKLGLAGKATETGASGLAEVPNTTAVMGLHFSDTSHGWASLSDGRLLSTPDGGLTWKDVSLVAGGPARWHPRLASSAVARWPQHYRRAHQGLLRPLLR